MRKLALFAGGYAVAAFAAVLVLPGGALLPLGGFCVLLTVIFACIKRIVPDPVRRRAILCAAGMAVGFVWTWCYDLIFFTSARNLDDRTVTVSGTVIDWPEESDYNIQVKVKLHIEDGADITALLRMDKEYLTLQPGDRIRTIAHCSLASKSVRGEAITYYTSDGILLTAKTYGDVEVERPKRLPLAAVGPMMSRALNQGIRRSLPADTHGLLCALITGDKSGLGDSFQSDLQRTGLSHMVVVSGMHLAYISSFVAYLLGSGRKRTAAVTIPLVLLVSAMAGFTPSVIRASVMMILLHIAPLFNRQGDSATSLSLAMLLLLLQNPYCAASISLLLSFGAVSGILLFAAPVRRKIMSYLNIDMADSAVKRLWNFLARVAAGVISVSVGAMAFTVPVSVVTFGKISLISPVSNLLCFWAVSGAYLCGMIAAGIGLLWPWLGEIIGMVAAPFARYLINVIQWLSDVSFAAMTMTGYYCVMWLLLVYGLLGLAMLVPGKKRWSIPAVCCIVMLILAVVFTGVEFRAGELTSRVLDVGQGQSVLLYCKDEYALVDCGGNDYINAGDTAADQLESMGRNRLDMLVISHYHDDHANGVPQLLKRVEVERIYLPDVPDDTGLRGEIEDCARDSGTTLIYVTQQTSVPFGKKGQLTIYPPFGKQDANELGLTVLCSVQGYDVLMTGDMGEDMERLLTEQVELPDVELMVAGHHGSKYSSSRQLLDRVKPDVVVFSVGINNSYGHPAPEVLQRFDAVGAKIYRTDLMGAVTVTSHTN